MEPKQLSHTTNPHKCSLSNGWAAANSSWGAVFVRNKALECAARKGGAVFSHKTGKMAPLGSWLVSLGKGELFPTLSEKKDMMVWLFVFTQLSCIYKGRWFDTTFIKLLCICTIFQDPLLDYKLSCFYNGTPGMCNNKPSWWFSCECEPFFNIFPRGTILFKMDSQKSYLGSTFFSVSVILRKW